VTRLPWILDRLLAALPEEFRQRHRREIAELLRAGVEGRGALSRWFIWLRAALDILWVALVLRVHGRRSGRRARRVMRPDAWPSGLASGWIEDLRHATRSLRRDRGLAALATVVVGLGIGASSTVYSVADALLLRPLPFHDPDRLVFISNGDWGRGQALSNITTQVARLQDLREQEGVFADVAGFYLFDGPGDHTLTGVGGAERVTRLQVTENFFPLLGVQPAVGRLFTPEEALDGGPRAALLPHGLWVRRFGADPGIVGRTIGIDGEPVSVVGVLPESFDYATIFAPGTRIDFVTPFPLNERTNAQGNTLALVGRLQEGVDVEAAGGAAAAVADRNPRGARNDFEPGIRPLREHVSGDVRLATLVLVGSVLLVMLIVCANLSNLLLARGAARQREFATRAALGAGRARLLRQMMAESVALAVAGAALGFGLAIIGVHALARLDANVPLLGQVRVDVSVVAFTATLALVTGILAGAAPAVRGSRSDLTVALKQGGRGSSQGTWFGRVRGMLVVSEVALACVLLIGAGLMIRSFVQLLDVDLGYRAENAVAVRVDEAADRGALSSSAARTAHFEQILDAVAEEPGVEAAGMTDVMPMAFNRRWCFDRPDLFVDGICPFVRVVSDGYLDAMGLSLVAGRDFTRRDGPGGRQVILVNEALANAIWPEREALGATLENWDGDWEVVGVVRGTRYLSVDQEPGPEVFFPMSQQADYAQVHLIARGSPPVGGLTAAIRQGVRSVDASVPLADFIPISDLVARSLSARRFTVVLLGGFALLALFLASLGIYGVISYSVTQRSQEIGIRMVLGASSGALQTQILGETLRLTSVGMSLGLLVAWALGRVMNSLLYEITSSDPLTFVAVPLVLTTVAVLAGGMPAKRAAQLDPVRTLAAEQ
jgi:predicted permease